MSQTKIIKSVDLYFRAGSSDKQYRVTLRQVDGLFVVDYANGKRGSALKTGTKTKDPLNLAQAEMVYAKLVKEKMAGGYTPGESGTPFADTANASQVSGEYCQLLNAIDDDEVKRYIRDDDWILQFKKDGDRRMLRRLPAGAEGVNRRGLIVALPQNLVDASNEVPAGTVIDGEIIGNRLFVFDLLQVGEIDLRGQAFEDRLRALQALVFSTIGNDSKDIIMVQSGWTYGEKQALYRLALEGDEEGVVFKRRSAPYSPGRPNSGGDQLKFKFWNTATVRVSMHNSQRSVGMEVLADEKWLPVGNVTIPPNKPIPAAGAVIEVRYLYAYEGGSIFQPTYLQERNDVGVEACLVGQLKYKAPEPDAVTAKLA